MIAALYIDPRGPYPKMRDVDCWDLKRDAKYYEGSDPVVAHPPCGPWGAFAHLCKSYEQDRCCALRAVEQVRASGGILEHPAGSRLWDLRDLVLPPPSDTELFLFEDKRGGYTVEVDQCAWGHVCRKLTWLYCVGVDRALIRSTIRRGGTPTRDMTGYRGRNATRLRGLLEASKEQRRRTPIAFAEWLVSLARSVNTEPKLSAAAGEERR